MNKNKNKSNDVQPDQPDQSKQELVDQVSKLKQEIENRKIIEASLRHIIVLYREAEKFARVGHWEWDRQKDKMIFCSDGYARIMGTSLDDAIVTASSGIGDSLHIHPDDKDHYISTVGEFEKAAGKELLDLEYRIVNAQGEYRNIHERGDTVYNENGKDIGSYGIMLDITQYKEIELALQDSENQLKEQVVELREKEERLETQASEMRELTEDITFARDELKKLNDQKDKFFAIIAHDLKAPFNSLLMLSQTLSLQADILSEEEISRHGSLVYCSSEQAFKLLEDLLKWSHLQLDRVEFAPEAIDIGDLLNTNLARFNPIAQAKYISIESDKTISVRVLADRHMIDTVLRNLISNAIKFTETGGEILLGVTTKNDMVEITVSDTGVGMSLEKTKSIFDIGVKTATKGTDGETGTGLGLQLCYELIDKHNGEIGVSSNNGEGSTFRFTLPIAA